MLRNTSWLVCMSLGLTGGLLTGCGTDGEETPDGPVAGEVTFWQDVAPIYYESCVGCHQSGGIGPFTLDSYEAAKNTAMAAKLATAERTMPPWLVTDDGSCGEFHGSRALSDTEIATIAAWVDGGMLEGQARTDLVVPEPPSLADGTDITTPDFIPEIVGGPLAENDEYRCFAIDPQLDRDVFLTGYDVLPGNPALVHHVLLITVDPEALADDGSGRTNREVMNELDGASPDRDGWPCFGAAGNGVAESAIPISWAPGQGVTEFPAGTGARIRQGEIMVLQMHYNLTDPDVRGQSDSTTVRLRLADSVEREGFFLLPDLFLDTISAPEPASLEPRKESVLYTWDLPLEALFQYAGLEFQQVELYGVFPHMHRFGRKQNAQLMSAANNQCLADVQNWRYGWQIYYFYEAPVVMTRNDTLRVTCDYDTRDASEPVTPGWGTDNEMCLLGIYLVP